MIRIAQDDSAQEFEASGLVFGKIFDSEELVDLGFDLERGAHRATTQTLDQARKVDVFRRHVNASDAGVVAFFGVIVRVTENQNGRVTQSEEESFGERVKRRLQSLLKNVFDPQPGFLRVLQIFVALFAGDDEEAPILEILSARRVHAGVQDSFQDVARRHVGLEFPDGFSRLDQLIKIFFCHHGATILKPW